MAERAAFVVQDFICDKRPDVVLSLLAALPMAVARVSIMGFTYFDYQCIPIQSAENMFTVDWVILSILMAVTHQLCEKNTIYIDIIRLSQYSQRKKQKN